MKNLLLSALALTLITTHVSAQVFWTEDFETDGSGLRYFVADAGDEFVDSSNDHYGRTDGSNTTGSYTGMNGSYYWAGEDLDDSGSGNQVNPKTLTFAAQDITGMNMVELSGLFAQGSSSGAGIDVADFMDVQYRVDGGAWTSVIYFAGIDNGGAFNNGGAFDSDGDQVGDLPLLTSAFASFSSTIAVSGASIEVQIIMSANSGSEELAYDFIQLSDVSVSMACSVDAIADGGNQSSCNPATDTYSNDVTVSYSNPPASGTLDINGQSFAITSSPQTVTLTGLIADGAPLDVTAAFSAEAGCTLSTTGLIMAPASCAGDFEAPVLSAGCITENASSSSYDDGWQSGDGDGMGFGTWLLTSAANSGHIIGTSDIDVAGESWGIFAHSSDLSDAVISFDPMSVGSTFSMDMDNGLVQNGGTVGVSLQNAAGDNLWEFFFEGGTTSYQITDAAGAMTTGLAFTTTGVHISLMQDATGTLAVTITDLNSSMTWSPASSSTLAAGGGDQVITSCRLYNSNAGSASANEAYFNSIEVCNPCPPAVSVACADMDNLAITGQPTATDNVDPAPSVTYNDVTGACSSGVFTVTRTWTATDAAGNSSSCDQILTVTDLATPTVLCQDLTVTLDAMGTASIIPADVDNGSFDGCGTISLSLDQSTFDCADAAASPVTVTLTAIDDCGNSDQCTALVTVNPSIFCFPNTLVINEVDYDQEGTDSEEYIEIYNTGTSPVDLSNYTIDLINGTNGTSYSTIVLNSVMLAADDYYVIGAATVPNVDQVEFTTNGIQNGSPDGVQLIQLGVVVDAISYEGDIAGTTEGTGASGEGQTTGKSTSRIPNGVDTDENSVDFAYTCATPGTANVLCPANDLCEEAQFIFSTEFGGPSGYITGTLLNATPEVVCGGTENAVWYEWQCMSSNDVIQAGVHPALSTPNTSGFDAVIEVFDACDGNSLGCFDNYGPNELERALVGGLTVGSTYVYAVYHNSSSGAYTSPEFSTTVKGFVTGDIRPVFCGITTYDLSDAFTPERMDLGELYAFPGVTVVGYAVRLTDQSTAVEYYKEQFFAQAQYFQFSDFSGLPFNSTFDAEARHMVRIAVNGAVEYHWSEYGDVCTLGVGAVSTTNLMSQYCSGVPDYVLGDILLAEPVADATAYEFEFNDGTNMIYHIDNNYSVQLWQVNGLEYNKTYTVRVKAQVNGVWGDYGSGCSINTRVKPLNTSLELTFCNGTFPLNSSQNLQATNIVGSDYYEWRFTPIGGGASLSYISDNVSLLLTELNVPGLDPGTYDVDVRSFGGNASGDFGPACPVNILPAPIAPFDALQNTDHKAQPAVFFRADIHPNPSAGNQLVLQLGDLSVKEGLTNIAVFDVTGKEVMATSFSFHGSEISKQLNFAEPLQTGLYLMRINIADENRTLRFIVE